MKFSEIGPLVHGVTKQDPASRPEACFDYIDLSSINRSSKAIEGPANLPTVEAPSRARQLVQAGDVLVSTVRPNLNAVARVPLELDGATASTGFTVLRAKADQLDPAYLLHWVRSDRFVKEMVGLATGANYPAVTDKIVKKSLIPLVPLEEQKRIASILDAADHLRSKRQQAIDQLDTLTQVIFYDMFREVGWDAWPMVPIADLAAEAKGSIRTGPFGSQLLHEEFVDGGVAVLGIDNVVQNRFVWGERRFVSEEKYEQLKRFRVFPGDVLVTIMGTCGRVAIVPPDIPKAINTKHLCCITLDRSRCLPIWLQACLMFHPEVLRRLGATHGAVMPGLNMGLVKGAEVPVPPVNVQERFAQLSDAAGQRLESANESLNELVTLFGALQQRAFRGDL
jgi:type I restriction enzyme S subunit